MKKKVLLTSILTIALCLTLIVGSTYALFTSGNAVNVAVTAGKLEVIATIGDLTTRSLEDEAGKFPRTGDFSNGGYAKMVENTDSKSLEIAYMTPGDAVKFNINVENNSNVALKYRVHAVSASTSTVDLADALVITVVVTNTAGDTFVMDQSGDTFTSRWIDIGWTADATDPSVHEGNEITSINVIVEFPNGNPDNTYEADGVTVSEYGDNHYQEANTTLTFTVEAVQANGVDANGELILP